MHIIIIFFKSCALIIFNQKLPLWLCFCGARVRQ